MGPAAAGTRRSRELRDKMGGNRSLLLLLLRISTGVCVKWRGEFSKPSYAAELQIEIVIVLIVAGLIFVIIVICIPIIYCCIKSRSKRERKVKLGEEEEGERDSIDDPFLMDLDNRHTKSELSIPYMDAS